MAANHSRGSIKPLLNTLPDARALHNKYNCASPFPHVVLDNAFDDRVLRKIAKEASGDIATWKELEHKHVAKKFVCSNPKKFGPVTRELIQELQSTSFCKWLEQLTGHRDVISDPHIMGGGLHAISTGGRLEIHADFNYSKQLASRRIINLLIYLNDDWKDKWGGHLELWNRSMTKKEVRVAPKLGNVVLFNTDSTSYHGHPEPLTCPEGVYRKSIALYYYKKGEPVEESHSTLYQVRKG